ncbi:TlpA family protein disulfide reductase [Sulfoacidibacillus thermotolerans]|uniref:Thioredoxin domain-containing protein n=1 Tax=Sulfoacidibacillus thermotolerans TaxID=1765684 RepID=A0A2U3D8R9_SULT2|nr:hypothetical protein [Sulfoacidibacillus thermotolerans]PWI57667.1 hypothetical protein BM613_07715 [Sulfoacidibacillus thermotolerans]
MKSKVSAAVLLAVALISGLEILQWHAAHTNPPFQNLLAIDKTTPLATYQPQPVSHASAFTHLLVETANGKPVVLDAKEYPLLFEAYWCPHCQRTLVLLNEKRTHLHHLPLFISTGFAPGTTLQQAVQLTEKESTTFGLRDEQMYFLLSNQWRSLIPEFPLLVFYSTNGKVEQLAGEHTFPVWKEALYHAQISTNRKTSA